ncbi:hypothetical protein EFP68_05765 [Lactobacillus helveticus]|uniref:hypothetical protein n=1 Tax=Lactobacillus helveticus TaxID=1587 RepID=UPI001C1E664A|nr:hypothetical protein [Lactobacillus helveticus]MBU5981277.1 hypothetical protein [Lactobacillus helveticus]MCT3414132.1 hypothetical protein [Lactobacillus helveticus]
MALKLDIFYLTSKIIYNLGSLPDWLSAIGTVSSVIVSLYFGFHRTKKPHVIFKLLEDMHNDLKLSASNFSSQYVSLVTIKKQNINFAAVNGINCKNKLSLNFINLVPIESKETISNTIPIFFEKSTIAKLVFKDNISKRKFKIYFVHVDNDWKIVPLFKYFIAKILFNIAKIGKNIKSK